MKSIKVVITDNGLEEVINLDPENDPNFADTLGDVLCEVFDVPAVEYSIRCYTSSGNALEN